MACFVQQKVCLIEVQFKWFCPPVKISCHPSPAENIFETHEVGRKNVCGWEGEGTEKGW